MKDGLGVVNVVKVDLDARAMMFGSNGWCQKLEMALAHPSLPQSPIEAG